MRLDRMADLYEQQVLNKTSQSLGFEEQLELLIDRVSARSKLNNVNRFIRQETFSDFDASIEKLNIIQISTTKKLDSLCQCYSC